MSAREQEVLTALSRVVDPEIGIGIVDLGLIYGVSVDESGGVDVLMTLTIQGCPMHNTIQADAARALETLPWATRRNVALTFEPPWTPERLTPHAKELLNR